MDGVMDNSRPESSAPELRNRKAMGPLTATKQSLNEMKDELAKRVSDSPYLQSAVLFITKLRPLFEHAQRAVVFLFPYLMIAVAKLQEFWIQLQPYHPEEFAPVIFGFIMCFFGGHFFTLFAAIEAYKVCGFDHSIQCLHSMHDDFQRCLEASAKDDLVDEDNNGIADVLEIPFNELVLRKLRLFVVTTNPLIVAEACNGLATGFMGVVFTLKIKFAQTVTLGNTIGNTFSRVLEPLLIEPLRVVFPQEYHQWIPVMIRYSCKTFGVSIAWSVQRVIEAFYSAIRGADILSKGLINYMQRMGYKFDNEKLDENSSFFIGVCVVVAVVGFFFQFWWGFFVLPFPLNILLLPLSILEWLLMYFVGIQV